MIKKVQLSTKQTKHFFFKYTIVKKSEANLTWSPQACSATEHLFEHSKKWVVFSRHTFQKNGSTSFQISIFWILIFRHLGYLILIFRHLGYLISTFSSLNFSFLNLKFLHYLHTQIFSYLYPNRLYILLFG